MSFNTGDRVKAFDRRKTVIGEVKELRPYTIQGTKVTWYFVEFPDGTKESYLATEITLVVPDQQD